VNPEAASAQIRDIEYSSNAFFACMTGEHSILSGISGLEDRDSCPPEEAMLDPRLRIRVRLLKSPPEPDLPPLIQLHSCYRGELPLPQRSDCQAVRDYAVQQCRDTVELWQKQGRVQGTAVFAPEMEEFLENISLAPRPAPSVEKDDSPDYLSMSRQQIQEHCERRLPPSTDGRYDRVNSANLTLTTSPGTWIHEIGHRLGLPDEYYDPTYPFIPLGEGDSVMRSSRNPKARLYPRHLARMIEPLSCPFAPMSQGAAP